MKLQVMNTGTLYFFIPDMKPGRKSLTNGAGACVLLAALLLLYHDPFLILWWPQEPAEERIPLDMATDSIDDMFAGCRAETAAVIDLLGVLEWHHNGNFSLAWALVERRARRPAGGRLQQEHAAVIYMYTGLRSIRRDFDAAVRTGKHNYNTHGFRFHYLYFYLTDAVRLLRGNRTRCRTVYHRTPARFRLNGVDTHMRFGAFVWGTAGREPLGSSGNASCFEIRTCFGADVTRYSAANRKGQVLIPPYEVFRVSEVTAGGERCGVVYRLQSTGTPRGDLNCELSPRRVETLFGALWSHWQSNTVTAACAAVFAVSALVLVKRTQTRFVAATVGALLLLLVPAVLWGVAC